MSRFSKSISLTRRRAHSTTRRPRSVEERRHHPLAAAELAEERGDLVSGENDRQARRPPRPDDALHPRNLDAEDVAVEKQERGQRLVLGRGADAVLDGEAREEALDLGRSHLARVPLAVEQDEAADPADVRSLGLRAAVAHPKRFAHAVEQTLAGHEPQRGPLARNRAGPPGGRAYGGTRTVGRLGMEVDDCAS